MMNLYYNKLITLTSTSWVNCKFSSLVDSGHINSSSIKSVSANNLSLDDFINQTHGFANSVLLCSLSSIGLLTLGLWSLYVMNNREKLTHWFNTSRFKFISWYLVYYFWLTRLHLVYCFVLIYISLFTLVYVSYYFMTWTIPDNLK